MKKIGILGEQLAAQHLKNQKFDIIAQNFYCKYGEIDIIAEKNNTIYFFEVKTRHENSINYPAESLTHQKLQRIIKSALTFLDSRRGTSQTIGTKSWRISLIGILLHGINSAEIEIIDIY